MLLNYIVFRIICKYLSTILGRFQSSQTANQDQSKSVIETSQSNEPEQEMVQPTATEDLFSGLADESDDERELYNKLYIQATGDISGKTFVKGKSAVDFFRLSGLERNVLRQVCLKMI